KEIAGVKVFSRLASPELSAEILQAIEVAMSYVDQEYLVGLGRILIINTIFEHSNQKKIQKLRPSSAAMGYYLEAKKRRPATIELFADRILRFLPTSSRLPRPLLRELGFAVALYHEIGHHIGCMSPEHDLSEST